MRIKELKKEIEIPEGVDVKIDGKKLFVNGPKGENSRTFNYPKLEFSKQGNKIMLLGKNATKKEKTMIGTYSAHIKNLFAGVKSGFDYRLKICSGHFPMTVVVEKNKVMINNFMGEKVGQTAANIELATRRPGFDKRIFQDGCYIVSKSGKELR